MNRNFPRSLKLVLEHEGGWADHPSDPGGATMKGITIATYRRYVNAKGTKADLRNISDADVATVYRKQYWDAIKGDDLPDGLDFAVFDFAVNSGPGRAAKYLQRVVGVAQDGKIGAATLSAARDVVAKTAINALCDARLAFLRGLKTWRTFGKGWSTRVAAVRKEALAMTGAERPAPALDPSQAILKLGAKGRYVEDLQQNLTLLGYPLKLNGGVFDEGTEKAVKAFQRDHKDADGNALKDDGIAGSRTTTAIGLALKAQEVAPKLDEARKNVPATATKEVKEKTGLWGWIVGLAGGGGTALSGAFGAEWQTVLAIGAVGIVGLVVVFLLRRQIIAAFREINEEAAR